MKKYTKTYLNHFGLTTADYVPCEIPGCGQRAVDIHHIEARSIAKHKENEIENLMALCRAHHMEYGDKKQHKEMLVKVHKDNLKKNK